MKKFFKFSILFLISLPLIYFLGALITTYIPVNSVQPKEQFSDTIYLHSNGVHLDIALPRYSLDSIQFSGLFTFSSDQIISFGWGDANFYLNTPEWKDLSFEIAFQAAFLKSPTLMHVSRYSQTGDDWRKIPVTKEQLQMLNQHLSESFEKDTEGNLMILPGNGYYQHDDFYKAHGNYHLFQTCNSWANDILKKSGLKASLWTPFDFGLLSFYD
ncbi:MAG: TIGR02117 family protein [Flavobacteriaceae bacterium]|nr:TIGR02117 family protein [Flavobacteriaceae bacterium]